MCIKISIRKEGRFLARPTQLLAWLILSLVSQMKYKRKSLTKSFRYHEVLVNR